MPQPWPQESSGLGLCIPACTCIVLYMSTTKITRTRDRLSPEGYRYYVGHAQFRTRVEAVAAVEAIEARIAEAPAAEATEVARPTRYRPGAGYVLADGGYTQIFDHS